MRALQAASFPVNSQLMRLRNIPEAKDIVAASPHVVHDPRSRRGSWKSGRPLFIEIGMGKGRFIIETASVHPENDYLGIERYESVLFRACERMDGIPYSTPADQLEREADPEWEAGFVPPSNLRFLCMDAAELPEVFAPGEVDGIYLNFSDPWPKARHAKRRLTSKEFLARYESILRCGGRIEFKTDNSSLFEFSVEEIGSADHWEIEYVTRNLHRDPVLGAGNIMTEYERKFSNLGNPIMKLAAVYRGQ